ncbi:MAG: DUF4277 domain-containing protein [Okeania sp. SIO3B3]|nr:DUF4277 domain-containing protein [Okeania sp. SIO3B3]
MEHLLGKEVKPEYLNDDRLGRVLDKIYEIGLNKIFVFIILEIIKKYQLVSIQLLAVSYQQLIKNNYFLDWVWRPMTVTFYSFLNFKDCFYLFQD